MIAKIKNISEREKVFAQTKSKSILSWVRGGLPYKPGMLRPLTHRLRTSTPAGQALPDQSEEGEAIAKDEHGEDPFQVVQREDDLEASGKDVQPWVTLGK